MSTPPTEHWRRFALMDVMVIVLCCALGLGLMRAARGFTAMGLGMLVLGPALGAVVAVPALLASQCFFRGRREPLWLGETLGTIPACGLSAAYGLAFAGIPVMVWPMLLMAWFAIQLLCALGSCAYLINAWLERRIPTPRPWTDTLGAWVGALGGGFICFGLGAMMAFFAYGMP
jgi:hypothetical protein